ncbi:hypothetical protein PAI11_18040 [Patulibacter medicamentivorans]|jgi:hypothetical protein|uniref:Uncharacterized protein n=1 Tax=Patulibacter medicamentivorans TaxID=1097667 RepID=H0E4S3_9ACTN|nr:hypothetical protein [Patulibacter medicamentivorans]EHN11323.1 hypothetical protein PAI11_18040 [Patulibacter medicamentivorans]
MTDTTANDSLDELRERIRATQEAAERLHREAAEANAAEAAGEVPPAGWATPQDRSEKADEVHALALLLRTIRDLLPSELQAQVNALIRELLILVRAIIDWWVLHLEGAPGRDGGTATAGGPRVQDIPIG